MIIKIDNVISKKNLDTIIEELTLPNIKSEWKNGKETASGFAKVRKHNFELDPSSLIEEKNKVIISDIVNHIKKDVYHNPEFKEKVAQNLTFKVNSNCFFARYDAPTNDYDFHIDNPIAVDGTPIHFAISLMLNDNYEGGELIIKKGNDEYTFKGEAGSMVIFPTYCLHKINKVTKGSRFAFISWITTLIYKEEYRELYQLVINLEKNLYSNNKNKEIENLTEEELKRRFNSIEDYNRWKEDSLTLSCLRNKLLQLFIGKYE